MQKFGSRILLSATDLVTFHECEHASALDRAALDDAELRAQRVEDDETSQLFQKRGHAFEAAYLAGLRRGLGERPGAVVEIAREGRDPERAVAATVEAMRAGADLIYQATLVHGDLIGHADFLRKVSGQRSAFGDHAYEVVDTKLARRAKAAHVLQLSFYGELVASVQQVAPRHMHVVLGNGQTVTWTCSEYSKYFSRLLQRFQRSVGARPDDGYPTPCNRCDYCHWRGRCEDQRAKDDSLYLVAGIRGSQVGKLHAAGILTLAALGRLPPDATVPRMAPPSFSKLREQAAMQLLGRESGRLQHRLVEHPPGEPRGFAQLPPPDDGDVYFDMEGDPLYTPSPASAGAPTPLSHEMGEGRGEVGLEYLFGVLYRDATAPGGWAFKAFWGHSRADERAAFEQFMDWVAARIERHPRLHVYHYASYEDSALKRLCGRHATREALLDRFLRERRLVDLYQVTREAIRASTPSYSIKAIEKFYRGAREGEVQSAGASIVYYERFLETGDRTLLEDIERYNEDDVRSLQQLHAWLLGERPAGMPWRGEVSGSPDSAGAATGKRKKARTGQSPQDAGAPSLKLQAYLDEVEAVREPLMHGVPEVEHARTPAQRARALMADLLEFHRRCEKPKWWEMFARAELTFDELLENVDAIAGLQRVAGTADEYEYPTQEVKFEASEYAVWLESPACESVRIVALDEERRRVRLARSGKNGPLPEALSLGKRGPLASDVLKDALLRSGRDIAEGNQSYRALEALLEKQLPRLAGREPGQPIVADPATPLEQVIDAVTRLDDSYLFIQGPPGAGKTYTASHVIAALLAQGKRIAVSSNSHKAINNLLAGVEKVLLERGQTDVRGCKKFSDEDHRLNGQLIVDVDDNAQALSRGWQLVGGTAWLFARPEAAQQFDYLFVDEAGQVALGNLAAIAPCARNLVLLGDQMQLSQPIQGVHPGRSGESSLDYLLDGRATVPPERGIFLSRTWRMCPDVCRFISAAVYDGRLEPEAKNANQRLVLAAMSHPALRPTGVVFWPMDHAGCSQRSVEEAEEIRRIYASLLGRGGECATPSSWIDRDGVQRPLTPEDILVVAPYNMQVNLLRRTLPPGARVGTVDKFQGQEAAVTLISMTTSSEDDLPRNFEFLFSKNRLNVAISRARCLSVVVANPQLLDTRCRSPEQIALVNTLCWAAEG